VPGFALALSNCNSVIKSKMMVCTMLASFTNSLTEKNLNQKIKTIHPYSEIMLRAYESPDLFGSEM